MIILWSVCMPVIAMLFDWSSHTYNLNSFLFYNYQWLDFFFKISKYFSLFRYFLKKLIKKLTIFDTYKLCGFRRC